MKKVVYSVTKVGKPENTKMTGIGYITDKDLIIACVGKNSKPYVKVFEDCLRHCHSIDGRYHEFKGEYYEIREVEIETKHNNYETRELELNYYVWFKYAD